MDFLIVTTYEKMKDYTLKTKVKTPLKKEIKNLLTYNVELLGPEEDLKSLMEILEQERDCFNHTSKIQFNLNEISLKVLHRKIYKKYREVNPLIHSQLIIKAEQECIATYRSIKSNKHQISQPALKKNLSCRLDHNLYSRPKNPYSINLATTDGRKIFNFKLYPKVQESLDKSRYRDPLLFVRNGKIYIALSFEVTGKKMIHPKTVLGVDLGIRVIAACSDGRLIKDESFNSRKRKIRYLKRKLQSRQSKSARKHLKKLRYKEQNSQKNQSHLIANEILKNPSDAIALENLKGIKNPKRSRGAKNRISQVPFYELRRILTYKAQNMGKKVILVNPKYTSQIDSLTGKRDGKRVGRRYYAKSGLVYDADLNASRNIAIKTKLPVSYGNILDGQGVVNHPKGGRKTSNVCQSKTGVLALQATVL